MLNRYAKVEITRFEKRTTYNEIKQHYYVRIQRFGRTFPENYGDCEDCWSDKDDGITLSSYQRLMRVMSHMQKHAHDGSNFFNWTDVYEWQPVSPKYYYQCLECKSIVLSDDPWLSIGCYDCDTYQGMSMRLVEKYNVK